MHFCSLIRIFAHEMDIFGNTSIQAILFFVLYGITGVVPLIAAFYLLLRRANAIAPSVTPPVRLRCWTASFFAVSSLAHVWWLLFYILSCNQNSLSYLVLAMLDCVLLFITFAGTLLTMLQDRRRPVWPALVAMIPFMAITIAYMVYPNSHLEEFAAAYLLLLSLVFTGYMAVSIRQYGQWLNDNYADLENKKVWLCQAIALVCMLLFILYVLAVDIVILWLVHIIELVIVGLLLWRVETMPLLELPALPQTQQPTAAPVTIDLTHIEQLLKEKCVAQQLYLQHDLTLEQLAQAIGTNRFYLSQYFSRQSITYNTYINNLRINYFIKRYEDTVAAQQSVSAQQLAQESGFRSYSTFSRAFTQRTGQSVTAWMRRTE